LLLIEIFIIGNFLVYQDRVETNFLEFLFIIFEVTIVVEQWQALFVTIFLFFVSFHCPQLFAAPLPY